MDTRQFWDLIEDGRAQATDPADSYEVVTQASALLGTHPNEEIIAADKVMRELMAESYRNPLWAAAYVINGGCSDDGFDYFRGWLIAQGREVFEQVIADPDALVELPAVQAAAETGMELECEEMWTIATSAYRTATGEEMPDGSSPVSFPELDQDWDFDFDDEAEMRTRLPRLAELYLN